MALVYNLGSFGPQCNFNAIIAMLNHMICYLDGVTCQIKFIFHDFVWPNLCNTSLYIVLPLKFYVTQSNLRLK